MKRLTVLLPKKYFQWPWYTNSHDFNSSHVQQMSPATWWTVTTYYHHQVKSPPLLTGSEGESQGCKGSRDCAGIKTLRVLANSWSYPFNLSPLYLLYRSIRSNFYSFSSPLTLTIRIHNLNKKKTNKTTDTFWCPYPVFLGKFILFTRVRRTAKSYNWAVCPHGNNSIPHWTGFHENWYKVLTW
jgi:hypothetical protein